MEEDADESDDDNEHDSDNDSQLEGDGVARSQNGDSTQQHSSSSAYGTHNGNSSGRTEANSCDLLWRGNMPKRAFVGFKFQESKNSAAARKMLKARGVEHFWDMVENADNIIASSEIAALL